VIYKPKLIQFHLYLFWNSWGNHFLMALFMSTEFSCTNLGDIAYFKLTNSKQFWIWTMNWLSDLCWPVALYIYTVVRVFFLSDRSLLTYCTLYLHSCTCLSVLCNFLTRIILEYNNTLAATCFERKLAGREKRTIAIQSSQLEALDLKKYLHFLFA